MTIACHGVQVASSGLRPRPVFQPYAVPPCLCTAKMQVQASAHPAQGASPGERGDNRSE